MIYSMNPFRWLRWLCQKIKYRKSKWQLYHCPTPLNKKGYEVSMKRMQYLGSFLWNKDISKAMFPEEKVDWRLE